MIEWLAVERGVLRARGGCRIIPISAEWRDTKPFKELPVRDPCRWEIRSWLEPTSEFRMADTKVFNHEAGRFFTTSSINQQFPVQAASMSSPIASPVVNASGKTRLRESLERAKRGEGPSVGQWLEFPGYSLARTIAPLGEDVSQAQQDLLRLSLERHMGIFLLTLTGTVGSYRR